MFYVSLRYDLEIEIFMFEVLEEMCGPIEKCCCCFPANVGVKFIGGFLILADITGMIYTSVILSMNDKVSKEVLGVNSEPP